MKEQEELLGMISGMLEPFVDLCVKKIKEVGKDEELTTVICGMWGRMRKGLVTAGFSPEESYSLISVMVQNLGHLKK